MRRLSIIPHRPPDLRAPMGSLVDVLQAESNAQSIDDDTIVFLQDGQTEYWDEALASYLG